MKRKICVVTGSRAEYGLLRPLMDKIKTDGELKLQLVATGMHLSSVFGDTYREIENDGFKIDRKIDIELKQDTSQGIARSTGLGIEKTAKVLSGLGPDIVVILGDRFETFAVAAAATFCRIPIAHLHGGESTFGVIDEALRHSITKMSHLHFTSTEAYRKRVVQLGESPERVFSVGAIGVDNIHNLKLLSKAETEKATGFKFGKHNLLVTFHPVTLDTASPKGQFGELLAALGSLKDTNMMFTKANADMGGGTINKMIDDLAGNLPDRVKVFTSMGQLRYLSAMRYMDAVVGNSSSGIIEAPSFQIGTINIGDRQKGRIKALSIIDAKPDRKSISKAIKVLYSKGFQNKLKCVKNPYGTGNAAERIVKVLKKYPLDGILKKSFYDVGFRANNL